VSDNIAEEIAAVKAQPGKDLLLYAGADSISALTRLGLIDEYRLRIQPVALGAGKPLFQDLEDQLPLEFIQAKTYQNGVLLLIYRPVAK
jgi:dihydrofolate reductase